MNEVKVIGKGTPEPAFECIICGTWLPLRKSAHYVSRGDTVTGLVAALKQDEPEIWDTFDCLHCGCQNRIFRRFRRIFEDPVCCDSDDESSGVEELPDA